MIGCYLETTESNWRNKKDKHFLLKTKLKILSHRRFMSYKCYCLKAIFYVSLAKETFSLLSAAWPLGTSGFRWRGVSVAFTRCRADVQGIICWRKPAANSFCVGQVRWALNYLRWYCGDTGQSYVVYTFHNFPRSEATYSVLRGEIRLMLVPWPVDLGFFVFPSDGACCTKIGANKLFDSSADHLRTLWCSRSDAERNYTIYRLQQAQVKNSEKRSLETL